MNALFSESLRRARREHLGTLDPDPRLVRAETRAARYRARVEKLEADVARLEEAYALLLEVLAIADERSCDR